MFSGWKFFGKSGSSGGWAIYLDLWASTDSADRPGPGSAPRCTILAEIDVGRHEDPRHDVSPVGNLVI